jgi:HlyD family secretion protein
MTRLRALLRVQPARLGAALGLGAAVVAGAAIGYGGPPARAAEPADAEAASDLAVTVVPAKRACFVETIHVTGVLVPRTEILVRPDRQGLKVSEILVQQGDTVAAGQTLARLAPPEGDKTTDRVSVQAPEAGVVNSVSAVIGATASVAAQPLFAIVKHGELDLLAEASTSALSRLAPNQDAKVEVIGVGELNGKVRRSSATINPQTQLGQVYVDVANDSRLRVGAFGRATIDVGRSCGATIPLSAVLYGSDGTVVQVVREGRVETRAVTVGLIDKGRAEISDGLSEGDVVVARAGAFLRDGDRVRPVSAKPTKTN